MRIIVTDNLKELYGFIPKRMIESNAGGISLSEEGKSTVIILAHGVNGIIHEAEHIKNAIWKYIGYKPQKDNDEVDACLLTCIHKKIMEVFCKHNRIFR